MKYFQKKNVRDVEWKEKKTVRFYGKLGRYQPVIRSNQCAIFIPKQTIGCDNICENQIQ